MALVIGVHDMGVLLSRLSVGLGMVRFGMVRSGTVRRGLVRSTTERLFLGSIPRQWLSPARVLVWLGPVRSGGAGYGLVRSGLANH